MESEQRTVISLVTGTGTYSLNSSYMAMVSWAGDEVEMRWKNKKVLKMGENTGKKRVGLYRLNVRTIGLRKRCGRHEAARELPTPRSFPPAEYGHIVWIRRDFMAYPSCYACRVLFLIVCTRCTRSFVFTMSVVDAKIRNTNLLTLFNVVRYQSMDKHRLSKVNWKVSKQVLEKGLQCMLILCISIYLVSYNEGVK